MNHTNVIFTELTSMDFLNGWVQAEIITSNYNSTNIAIESNNNPVTDYSNNSSKTIRDAAQNIVKKIRSLAINIFENSKLPNPNDLPIEEPGDDTDDAVDMNNDDNLEKTEKKRERNVDFQTKLSSSSTLELGDQIDLHNSLSRTGSCVVYHNKVKKHCCIFDVGTESSFVGFFEYFSCYNLMPYGARIIILDINLKVSQAYTYLLRNKARAAPVWDQSKGRFVAMFTVTDFIKFLHKYSNNSEILDQMEDHTIKDWRQLMDTDDKSTMIHVNPENSLKKAAHIINKNNIHRLPVIDANNGNLLAIMTNSQLFRFFYHKMMPCHYVNPNFLKYNPAVLNLGRYNDDVTSIRPDQTIAEAIRLFCNYCISSLPVVNSNNQLINVYSRFDVINLVEENRFRNLEITIMEAITFRQIKRYPCTCRDNDSLEKILETIYKAQVHRIFIIDSNNHIKGVISLSDILSILCQF